MAAGLYNAMSMAQQRQTEMEAIAHPQTYNPLGAMQAAAQTAGTIFNLRQQQANQAIGGILQQATDQNGNVDYGTAQAMAARSGPIVQMGMQEFLRNNSVLRGQQIQNAAGTMHMIGSAALSGISDQSDENLNAIMDNLKASGLPTDQVEGERSRWLAMNQTQRKQEALRLAYTNLDGLAGLQQNQGEPFTYTAPGGRLAGGLRDPRTGALSVSAQPGVQLGLEPGQDQPVTWTDTNNVTQHTLLSDYQTAIRQGRAKGSAFDVNGRPIAGTGNMQPVAPRQPSSVPQAPPAPPTGATLRGSTTGAYTPPGTPQGPTNQPAPPPQTQPPQPRAAVATPPALSGPTVATTSAQQQDQDAYKADIGQMQDMVRRNVAGNAALDALELARTGPGTSTVAQKLAFLQAQGVPLPFGPNPNDYSSAANYEVLQKNLLRFAQNSSQTSGTDLGLRTQIASNADADHMLPAANRHVVLQDLGLLRQRMAMVRQQDATGVGYRDQQKNFPLNTDPNAFAWDKMRPEERQDYLKQIDPKGTRDTQAFKKWSQSMAIARDTGVWQNQPSAQ